MNPLRPMLLAAALAIGPALASPAFAQPVFFDAKDGVKIYGDFRRAEGSSRGTILLFHMAGSNKSEYAPLAPILNKAGFSTLAIDQRSGGDLWGDVNKTAANAKGGSDFADAIPDLEAAITYGSMRHAGPIAVWGSSYSSALVFVVAARHPEVKALLAFSPGNISRVTQSGKPQPSFRSPSSSLRHPTAVRYRAVRRWRKRCPITGRFNISQRTACTDRRRFEPTRIRKERRKTGSMSWRFSTAPFRESDMAIDKSRLVAPALD